MSHYNQRPKRVTMFLHHVIRRCSFRHRALRPFKNNPQARRALPAWADLFDSTSTLQVELRIREA
jgi:hypothetical protein